MSEVLYPASVSPAEHGESSGVVVPVGSRQRRVDGPGRRAGGSERPAEGPERPTPVRLLQLRRALFAAATAFLSINLWTGAPLFSLWVGSQAAAQQTLSMAAVLVVVLVLAVLTLGMSVALLWLEGRYRRLVGHPLRENRLTWMRAFNAQHEPVRRVPMSMVEHIVTLTVYVAVIALIVWFVLFAGSPLPHG